MFDFQLMFADIVEMSGGIKGMIYVGCIRKRKKTNHLIYLTRTLSEGKEYPT